MSSKIKYLFAITTLLVLAVTFTGCIISAGTHGSIKGYRYPITKDKLEIAVMSAIKSNPDIYRDSTNKNYIIDKTNGKNDTIIDNYYNDGKSYLTIKIKDLAKEYEYTFRYYGGEEDWKVSSSSEIFICYITDDNGKALSEGNGDWQKASDVFKKKVISLFEVELVAHIDKELNLTHTETE